MKTLVAGAWGGLLVAFVAGVAIACGGSSGPPPDLTKIYDTITFYPASTLDGGPVAPSGIVKAQAKDFVNDRRMAVRTPNVTREQVLDYYAKELPKLGWKKEDPAKPKVSVMKSYCQIGLITCLSFLKDNVRMIVSSPTQLGLNPVPSEGVSYHFHLEAR